MADEKSGRGRGRPPKAATERRRHIQTFRCNDALRAALEQRAEANQRSVSEEVEYRIQVDIDREDERRENLRDPNFGVTEELTKRIREGMSLLRGYVGDDWPNDTAATAAMFYLVYSVAEDFFKPKPEKDWSKSESEAIAKTLEAADKVADVITWRDDAPKYSNKLMELSNLPQPQTAKEVFASRKRLAEVLERQKQVRSGED